MNILNQFSYPLISIGVMVVAYIALTRIFSTRWYITAGAQLLIAGILFSGFVILQPGHTTVSSADEALTTIGNGRPTFVEFFSNYCTVCLTLNPFVEQLISEIEDDFNVIQINIHSAAGRELRERLRFSFTPEFILYDANGKEIWREHILPTDAELNTARASCISC